MRILASAILLSLALSFPVSAKTVAEVTLNQNIEQKIKNSIPKNIKSNQEIEADNQGVKTRADKIISANDSFISLAYIPGISSASSKRFSKLNAGRKYNLPLGNFTINASAYTAAADECGKSDGITASGIKVHRGTLACPSSFPFGTKIEIDGMGMFTCEDRGGAIKGNHVDIYMSTKKEAFAFGRRNLIAAVVR
jgi:3D (Asp-Asp-Asp) domain-containing protein